MYGFEDHDSIYYKLIISQSNIPRQRQRQNCYASWLLLLCLYLAGQYKFRQLNLLWLVPKRWNNQVKLFCVAFMSLSNSVRWCWMRGLGFEPKTGCWFFQFSVACSEGWSSSTFDVATSWKQSVKFEINCWMLQSHLLQLLLILLNDPVKFTGLFCQM